jgi:hypothetical protein
MQTGDAPFPLPELQREWANLLETRPHTDQIPVHELQRRR